MQTDDETSFWWTLVKTLNKRIVDLETEVERMHRVERNKDFDIDSGPKV